MYGTAAPPAPGAWTLGDTALALIWPCILVALYLGICYLIGRRKVRRQRAEPPPPPPAEPDPEPVEPDPDDDPYTILQVSPDADPEVIEAAFRAKARRLHPDVSRSPTATREMQRLSRARYDALERARERETVEV